MPSDYICRGCGRQGMSVFYEAKEVPVNSCQLMPTRQQAIQYPRGNIVLAFCKKCGFISNVAFEPSKVEYSATYEDQQCYSNTFNVFAQNLAKRLIDKHNLHNKHILEIGCGKGDFLALLCEIGQNYGVGIDPSYAEDRIKSKASDRLMFIRDYYSERYAKYHGDFVCCRHTLEHIYDVDSFVNTVRHSIDDSLNTVVFFEVPDVTRVLQELAFWDIYYEHCSYFSLGSLARLFRSSKFHVTDLCRDFEDQYLLIEAKPADHTSNVPFNSEESVDELAGYVNYFSSHCRDKLDRWKERLHEIHADRRRIVIWGSGSKCVSFLTTLGVRDTIQYVIDINPHRHGKFLPGIGTRIMPPAFLKEYKPDVTIVMNPVYCAEIRQMLDHMQVGSEVIPV